MTKRNAIELLEKRYYEKDMTQEEQDTLETKNFFFFVVGLYGMEVVKSDGIYKKQACPDIQDGRRKAWNIYFETCFLSCSVLRRNTRGRVLYNKQ